MFFLRATLPSLSKFESCSNPVTCSPCSFWRQVSLKLKRKATCLPTFRQQVPIPVLICVAWELGCVPLCPLVVKAGWDAMRVSRNGDHYGLEITKCAHCCIEELVWNVLRAEQEDRTREGIWSCRKGTCPGMEKWDMSRAWQGFPCGILNMLETQGLRWKGLLGARMRIVLETQGCQTPSCHPEF